MRFQRFSSATLNPHADSFSRTCLERKGLAETKRLRPTAQQPATKSGRGPPFKPLINRLLCSPVRVGWGFVCACFRAYVQDGCLRGPGGKVDSCLLGASRRRRPIPPRPAPPQPPRHAPPVESGFWTRPVLVEGLPLFSRLAESKAWTHHGRVWAAPRTVGRRSGAGRDADGTVRPGDNRPACPPDNRKQVF